MLIKITYGQCQILGRKWDKKNKYLIEQFKLTTFSGFISQICGRLPQFWVLFALYERHLAILTHAENEIYVLNLWYEYEP